MSQKKVIRYLFIGLGFLVLFMNYYQRSQPAPQEESRQQMEQKKERKQTSDEPIQQARATLEKPDDQLGQAEKELVQQSLEIAMAYLTSLTKENPQTPSESLAVLDKLSGTVENRLSLTQYSMLQLLLSMQVAGYEYQKEGLEVYPSEADNVYQFVFVLARNKEEQLTFVGNYVTGTKQLEITAMQGTPVIQTDEKQNSSTILD